MKPSANRLAYLDGLRALAILLVIGYHYFAYWTPPLSPVNRYPYEGLWASFPLFHYGFYGVPLFFIISGFVIAMSLHRSANLADFALRRIARLWPTMALCSALTFAVVSLLPFFSVSVWDFLPSLTFLDPKLYNAILPVNAGWMDAVYWTLFIEVRFYALMALTYFIFPRPWFPRILMAAAIIIPAAYVAFSFFPAFAKWSELYRFALFPHYLPWFFIGTGFYYLAMGQKKAGHLLVLTSYAVLVIYSFIFPVEVPLSLRTPPHLALAATLFTALFYLAHYNTVTQKILSFRPLAAIGLTSYSLYLLHANIGLTLIHYLNLHLNLSPTASLILPFLVALLLIGVAQLIYKHWENPLNKALYTRFAPPSWRNKA